MGIIELILILCVAIFLSFVLKNAFNNSSKTKEFYEGEKNMSNTKGTTNYGALRLVSLFIKIIANLNLGASVLLIIGYVSTNNVEWYIVALMVFGMLFISVVFWALAEIIILFVNLATNSDKQLAIAENKLLER